MTPIERLKQRLVLVGAGNAHLQIIRSLKMRPLEETEVVVISPGEAPYSGMVPGYLAGEYSREEISIDLVKLCSIVGARWVGEEAKSIDLEKRRVLFESRAPLEFEFISLNVGSLPRTPAKFEETDCYFVTKPLARLLEKLDRLGEIWAAKKEARTFAVVGGGAGGIEIALALGKRWRNFPWIRVELHEANNYLVQPRASRVFEAKFREAGVLLHLGSRVDEISRVADGGVYCTGAGPTPLLSSFLAAKDEKGFLSVDSTLQSVSHDFLFGAGDNIAFPRSLPRSGVYAVRQGPILGENLRRRLAGRPARTYRPQKKTLALFNTSDQEAVAVYGSLVFQGHWVKRWKERIDRAWVEKFRLPPVMEMRECGGCGSKLDALSLEAALGEVKSIGENVILGVGEGEDVAAVRLDEGKVEVASLDAFRGFLDDPYLVGRIAALNALNDIWAKGISPKYALAYVGLSENTSSSMKRRRLQEVLAGARGELERHSVALVGGHTSELKEFVIGFTVWGTGDEKGLCLKRNLSPGEILLITKSQGTGTLLAALNRGMCSAGHADTLLKSMLASNAAASMWLREMGIRSCTDVSGFGLARHLYEMLIQSGRGAELWLEKIPVLPGADELIANGVKSQIHDANRASMLGKIRGRSAEILYDPQTSGGLLFSAPSSEAEKIARELSATAIGKVIEGPPEIHVV